MDGVYPMTTCYKQPYDCNGSYTGGTWASVSHIRDRGQITPVTQAFDEGYPDYLTNNSPPSMVYVRIAPSQYNQNQMVYWLNGWERPRLVLKRGKKYQFNINTPGYPFMLSIGTPPTDYFTTTYTIDNTVPTNFKYGCYSNLNMGGDVVVLD